MWVDFGAFVGSRHTVTRILEEANRARYGCHDHGVARRICGQSADRGFFANYDVDREGIGLGR